jgi:hypothetical protein
MTGTQPSWDGLQRHVGTAPIAMVLRFEAKVPGAPGVLRESRAAPDLRSPTLRSRRADSDVRGLISRTKRRAPRAAPALPPRILVDFGPLEPSRGRVRDGWVCQLEVAPL